MKFLSPSMAGILMAIYTIHSSVVSQSFGEEGVVVTADLTGQWGKIAFHPMILEPPDYYVQFSTDLQSWQRGVVWRLQAQSSDQAREILRGAGLTIEQAEALTQENCSYYDADQKQFVIHPIGEIIEELSSHQREHLYPQLLPFDSINPYFSPFAIVSGGIDAVLVSPTRVSPGNVDLIKQLCYKKAETWKFSDIGYVLTKASGTRERLDIMKLLGREISLSVELHVDSQSDFRQIRAYWSAQGRNPGVLPFLEAVSRNSALQRVDITHLLPLTARKLIHTFPSPDGEGIEEDLPDCFWTTFSFFADTPPDRYLDFVGHTFSSRYEVAEPPLQFGDILIFRYLDSEKWIHACNYIAGDVVFTKNGRSSRRPWIFSQLSRVLNEYSSVTNKKLHVGAYRLRPEFMQ